MNRKPTPMDVTQSVLSSAKAFAWPIERIVNTHSEQIKTRCRKRVSGYDREYCRGYRDAVINSWYRDGTLTFGYIGPDGKCIVATPEYWQAHKDAILALGSKAVGHHYYTKTIGTNQEAWL